MAWMELCNPHPTILCDPDYLAQNNISISPLPLKDNACEPWYRQARRKKRVCEPNQEGSALLDTQAVWDI